MPNQLTLEKFERYFSNINYDVTLLPISDTIEKIILEHYAPLYNQYMVVKLKRANLPEKQKFPGKLNERNVSNEKRKLTRPWDNCWFSNKPEYITRTVEEVFKLNPSYLLWCYDNLSIKWSEHTIKMFQTNPNFKLKN